MSRLPPHCSMRGARDAGKPSSGTQVTHGAILMGGNERMKSLLKVALLSTALMGLGGVAHAKDAIVWWDFLGGGDVVRMKALIDQFNAESADLEIQATTLEWGTPFYTKVQTSAAIGEGPDIMTYHESRIPLRSEEHT